MTTTVARKLPEPQEDARNDAVTDPVHAARDTATPSTLARAWRELAQQYPAWMLLFLTLSILNMALGNLGRPRWDLAWPTVFPLALFLGFYALRARFAPDVQHRWRLFLTVTALALGLTGLLAWTARPSPLDRQQLLQVYEISNFIAFVPLTLHAWFHARRSLVLFFGAALGYGVLLENGGITMGYFAELSYRAYVPGLVAPVATMLGWVMVIVICAHITWQARGVFPALRRSPGASAVVFAMAGVLFDLQIDPVATESGCWAWDPRLPGFFLGVPLVNYVAWFSALFPFGLAVFWVQDRCGVADGGAWPWRARRWLLVATPTALGVAAVLFFGSMTLLEAGWSGPTWQIFGDFTEALLSGVTVLP